MTFRNRAGLERDRTGRFSLRFELPDASRMKLSQSFEEFWRNLNNDQIFDCQVYFKNVFGRSLTIMNADKNDWPDFYRLIVAMDRAANVLSYASEKLEVMCSSEVEERSGRPTVDLINVDRLCLWLDEVESQTQDANFHAVLRAIANRVMNTSWSRIIEPFEPIEIDHLFRIAIVEPDVLPTEWEDTDIFISYKHRRYGQEASTLYDLLVNEHAMKCWLDREELRLQSGQIIEELKLKNLLRHALSASKLTVFFETVDVATADEDFRGNRIAFNWQVFEQRHSNRIVYIHPARRSIDFGDKRGELSYSNSEDLAAQIRDICRSDVSVSRRERFSQGGEGELRSLVTAKTSLEEFANEYYGRPVGFSSRTALIVLAPGGVERTGGNTTPLGDDVLINLLRYSPYAAIQLLNAGIDIEMMLAVGVKYTEALWQSPNEYRFPDMFGWPDSDNAANLRSPKPNDQLGERLDERSLLAGLFHSPDQNTSAMSLLRRTMRNVEQSEDKEIIERKVKSSLDSLTSALRKSGVPSTEQQWLIFKRNDVFVVRPIAVAAFVTLNLADEAASGSYAVALAHTHGVFKIDRLEMLESALSADGGFDEILSQFPVLAYTLDDAKTVSPVRFLEPPAPGDTVSELFLLPTEESAVEVGRQVDISNLSSGAKIRTARDVLTSLSGNSTCQTMEKTDWSPLTDLCGRQAVVLGTGSLGEPGELLDEFTLFDLHTSLLAPLWRYQEFRQLDYDSFWSR